MADESDITLKIVLDHVRALGISMDRRFDAVDKRFDRLESRMEGFEGRLDRMERNLTSQIDAIDQRLDAIEIENLPKRVAALEAHIR